MINILNRKNSFLTSRYENVLKNAEPVLSNDGMILSDIGKMSILAALLKLEFKEWVFCGFYRVVEKNKLEIGPYQGHVFACCNITFGKGLCGQAALKEKVIISDNVAEFPGYIACDRETVSEIVVPVFEGRKLRAVLDVDSSKNADFGEIDKKYLLKLSKMIYL